ncbi:pullulanase [Planococcaceae bacterium Storch 2/2-2]|nr:pullulanase [Planococcaceae bacterium Storch 2/2-2]
MTITWSAIEEILDPTGLIEGERYEAHARLMLDEEDELYRPDGIGVRCIMAWIDGETTLKSYYVYEPATDEVIDLQLEEDELTELVQSFIENRTRDN